MMRSAVGLVAIPGSTAHARIGRFTSGPSHAVCVVSYLSAE
jgi:hypothetical protein